MNTTHEGRSSPTNTHSAGPSFAEALRVWLRVAALSFGGPAGQIAVMHRILVDEKRWVTEERFLHALNYCMLLPGPEAQQLATYIGWLLHGGAGGLAAGILFIIPGFVAILTLSILYGAFHGSTLVAALFFGLKASVLAIVIEAVLRIGKRALRSTPMVAIAGASFAAIFFVQVPFPAIIISAAVVGIAIQHWLPEGAKYEADIDEVAAAAHDQAKHRDFSQTTLRRALRITAVCVLLWVTPIAILAGLLGAEHVFVREGIFFAKAAVVTFGGAYAVLAYVAQMAVEVYGWLMPGEMLDGLGMAETTPGPLVMVVQFVGFMAAYRNPAPFSPIGAGVIGSLVTVWVTFVPCFFFIFVGAPHIEQLRDNKSLSSALSAITAAVVGVILNLAVWFGLHVSFATLDMQQWGPFRLLVPQLASANLGSILITAAACVALFRLKWGMLPTLTASTLAGVLWSIAL